MTELCQTTATDAPAETQIELLTFRANGQAFAIDIMAVKEIRGWSEPTPIPFSEPHMLGMVNLRGAVLPVTDLSLRLGQARTPDDPRNVVIIVEERGAIHGLLVEAVSDIVRAAPGTLQDVPSSMDSPSQYAEHLFISENEMIQILDAEKIIG
jgi:purine-binding chemotaxis protein CheW